MNKQHTHELIRGKYISGFTVALMLVLPAFAWIALDRGMWRGDPVGYALNSVWLYLNLITNLPLWKLNLFHGYKAPLIFWIGQFFVPFGNFIGSINLSLLLVPLIATYITLVLSFRSFELLFKDKVIAFCGCLTVAASPLFSGLSTQFWIEPLQVAITSWFIYAMIKASTWNFYFALSQFIIALSLAMLIKVSSPLYIIGPAIAFWVTVFRGRASMNLNRKNFLFLLASLLFFFPAAVFYFYNLRAMLDFSHFAATSPLFGSDASKFDLWVQNMTNGIFRQLAFRLTILLLLLGIIKTIWLRAYGNFRGIFIIALFQIAVFLVAWLTSSNVDPRYFLPALPYFAIVVCWGLAAVNNRILTAISAGIFLIQFALVNGFAFGWIQLTPSYGTIRPLIREPDRGMCIMHDIMPLATRDSSIIFDLNPELGVAEFQYELAKQNLTGNWLSCCIDISAFFNYNRQQIDTGKINVETVWENVLAYYPDFYVTWNSRLSSAWAETEMRKIDKYNAATVPARWTIADKMKKCDLYEAIPFTSYPELLVYKRCDIALENLLKTHLIQSGCSSIR